jgi:ADP-glucose pyrophosphorylase
VSDPGQKNLTRIFDPGLPAAAHKCNSPPASLLHPLLICVQGTADAVRQYLWLFEQVKDIQEFLILAGDQLYRMDYQRFILCHRETGADITVAALPMDEARAQAFGLMKIDDKGRITEFAEKPTGDALKAMQVRGRWT